MSQCQHGYRMIDACNQCIPSRGASVTAITLENLRAEWRAEGFRAGLEAAAEWVEENVAVACDSIDTAAAIRTLTEKP